jgi:ferredoxin-NADP reductase/MOSC domain-containing protein YiiM
MTAVATLVSVNVGLPKDVGWQGRTVHTGIWKAPVDGPRLVRRLNVDGDGQGDLAGHGGEQRAVLVYQLDSYAHWREFLGRDDVGHGRFGENFTVDGLPDSEVCIGDRYRIGEAEFEVTQPRVTCFRVGMRLGEPRMAALLVAHHRPGFYLRVITEGRVRAGDPIVRTRTGPHRLSVADTDALLYLPGRDTDRLRAAVDIPALSPGWQQSFRELLAAGPAGGTAAGPAIGQQPAWQGFRALRVERVVAETPAVLSIYLVAADGGALPAARAGQYLTVRVAGAGSPAPVRSYSLSSEPGAAGYRISVKREDHGVVSRYLHQRLRPGAVVEAAAPRGEFVLDGSDRPVVLLSAGIGVTPVLAMLHELAHRASDREVWWVHTARHPGQQVFADEARRALAALPHAHVAVYYTGLDPAAAAPDGATAGRLTGAAIAALRLPAEAEVYLCGPAAFQTGMRTALTAAGLRADRVHAETFGALDPINPGVVGAGSVAPHQPAGPAGTGPAVTFARSGLTVPWSDRRRSVLELAEACDVPTRWSCRTGVCHTCVTTVLSGRLRYDPAPLEEPAAGQTLICSARPDTDTVLDL